jgi:mannitol-1-phosphate 5-dehydrogenase
MNPALFKNKVDTRKIVIFGAGKIGRSFIGQLFGCSGYQVVFIDTDQSIIAGLNRQGYYRVIIKGEREEEIIVPNVRAISAFENQQVIENVATAGLVAVSVGKSSLEKILPLIAAGLELRLSYYPHSPLDIIIAENMRDAADFCRKHLKGMLPRGYPFESHVGLVETSIGKMVPIMSKADIGKDPLAIYAESYNTLIADGKGFKLPVTDVKGLVLKENIKAWVDRKAFIHNLGHATAAYFGFNRHPEAKFLFEVLDDPVVLHFTKEVMLQSAAILLVAYPKDFTINGLEEHIDDLLRRFRNRALQDTIYRIGHDLNRKLGADDRFMGAIHLAIKVNMPYDKIIEAMCYGLHFGAKDEDGNIFNPDFEFTESLTKEFETRLIQNLGFDPDIDGPVIKELKRLYIQNQLIGQ